MWDADTAGGDPEPLIALDDARWSRVDLLQVRSKHLAAGHLESATRSWLARLSSLPTRVIVNDRLDVAIGVGAHGAHLGQDDIPIRDARNLAPRPFVLGASTHGSRELAEAEREGADYAGLGAFRATTTKADARVLDVGCLARTQGVPGIPVLAIGGVEAGDVAAALAIRQVSGVAVSAAIQRAADPGTAIDDVRGALDRAWATRGLAH